MKTIRIAILCLSIMLPAAAWAAEADYARAWCMEHSGVMEARLPDGTRCDCLTETHAVEVEFARKWSEAIGQSLFYALQTGKRAGIALILRRPEDYKYWIRLNTTIEQFELPIDTWMMEGEEL